MSVLHHLKGVWFYPYSQLKQQHKVHIATASFVIADFRNHACTFSASGEFPDFIPVNQELTFDPSANQLIQCATVQIVNDSLLESVEMFEAVLNSSDPDISIRPFSNTIVMIRNDDGMYG